MGQRAFTLIELLVVVAIISVLSTIGFVSFQGISGRSRDSHRKTDLQNLSSALEIYYQQNNQYVGGNGSCSDSSGFYTSISPYITGAVPTDPLTRSQYCYQSINQGASYRLYAKLENCSDAEIIGACSNQYNFSIPSPDLTAIAFGPSPSPNPSSTS